MDNKYVMYATLNYTKQIKFKYQFANKDITPINYLK